SRIKSGFWTSQNDVKNGFQLEYDKSVICEARLAQYREEEVAAGATLVGPHRDDIKFEIRFSQENLLKASNSKFEIKYVLDQWITSLLHQLIIDVTSDLESYDTVAAIKTIESFIENLSTWYVRRSRDRIGPTALNGDDKNSCYTTLGEVLVTLSKLLAPFSPFLAEEIFKNLTGEESVHLSDWPQIPRFKAIQPPGLTGLTPWEMIEEMEIVRKICELGHAERKKLGIKVRQPLNKFSIFNFQFSIKDEFLQLIKEELNVKKIIVKSGKGELRVELDTKITPELKTEGEARELVRQIQELRKEKGCKLDEKIVVYVPSYPKKFEEYIKKQTLAKKILCSKSLKISTG
ncbi:class I tRNA ligase family protein, partial [Candidatus Gottesmanbacteria bacterium]|nr:class I tRNA ligase family protein [Candidatus Gottesmanbacteria bacterium]